MRTSVLPLSLPNDPSLGAISPRPYNGLNIAQGQAQGCLKEQENLRTLGKCYRNATTINTLTDNVLVEIFDFCRLGEDHVQLEYSSRTVWKWSLLVHVCQRWRQIFFASPRRLHLEIFCTDGTPVRSNLGVWPPIPIAIQYGAIPYGFQDLISMKHYDEDNVIAALEHPDRVCHVGLRITRSQLGRIVTVMQEPFPILTCLSISSKDENVPVIPSSFLAGSAPCLQEIQLSGVPFPALPTLLLSASDLVELKLFSIPQTGYISPEVMVASLATLPKLKILIIGILSPDSPPGQVLLPPITRTVLPALNSLCFSGYGVCASVEDFLARIDTPQLDSLEIFYSNQVVEFEVPQLSEFINRSENLMRTLSRRCHIMIYDPSDSGFCIGGATSDEAELWNSDPNPGIDVLLDQKISRLAQVLSGISPRLTNIIHLVIGCEMFVLEPLNEPDAFEWLQIFRQFSSVRTLFVAAVFTREISIADRDIFRAVAAGVTVLPALELLCLEDGPVSSIDELAAARRDSGRPVTIVDSKEEFEKRLEVYPP